MLYLTFSSSFQSPSGHCTKKLPTIYVFANATDATAQFSTPIINRFNEKFRNVASNNIAEPNVSCP